MPKLPRTLYRHANCRANLAYNIVSNNSKLNQVEDDNSHIGSNTNEELLIINNIDVSEDVSNYNTDEQYFEKLVDDEANSNLLDVDFSDSDFDNLEPNVNQQNCEFNLITDESNNISVLDFSKKLASWAVKYQIQHNALGSLLALLKNNFEINLPLDPRTLLNTPRKLDLKTVDPGKYYHFGCANAVNNLISKFKSFSDLTCIELCINIDGLPISKSNGSQIYPILCNFYHNPNVVEIIGVYHGFDKPKNANAFLEDFVNEVIFLTNNGFKYNERIYSFKIVAFICDAPAKSFITYTKGHTGYNSCSKCNIEGNFLNNRVCFVETTNLKNRTNDEFIRKVDEDHHCGISLIESIPGVDMIRDIPLDYMHLICLGVARKLLIFWVSGKPPSRLSFQKITQLSNRLIDQAHNIPNEFVRKPRSLNELKRWKATEYRQFLFYTGPVVLKDILTNDMYLNFLCLHIATTILSNAKYITDLGAYAHSLYKYFIETFKLIYGNEFVSHNIHNLIHVYDDAKNFGILQNYSAFPFENYLQKFKPLLHKGDKPLSQIVKRKMEEHSCLIHDNSYQHSTQPQAMVPHLDGPLINNNLCTQYRKVVLENFILNLNEANNCCCLTDKSIVCIKNFISNSNGLFLIGNKFQLVENFYIKPCDSSVLGIFKVSKPGPLSMWSINMVAFKYVQLLYEDKFVVLPLLHTDK